MKLIILSSSLILFILVACKKEVQNSSGDSNVRGIKALLQDSMNVSLFESVDFSRFEKLLIPGSNFSFFRIGLKGRLLSDDFLLIQNDGKDIMKRARIIHVRRAKNERHVWNGEIVIESLRGNKMLVSTIENGFIKAFHPGLQNRAYVEHDPYVELPEVIIVSSYAREMLWSYELYMLSSFFPDLSGGGSGAPGYQVESAYYYNSGNQASSGKDIIPISEALHSPVEFEAEYIYSLPTIDVSKYFQCFESIPSNGATYKIQLCADVPSNNNPTASSNSSAVSGGHVFLTVTKTSGSAAVTQSFGFYPEKMPSFFNPFNSITSVIRDNGVQEINASIEMTISEAQFTTVKQKSIDMSRKKYELAGYNCANYAMDIFNSVRTNPIKIEGYQIILPGSTNPWVPSDANSITISKTPQMLFKKLREIKDANGTEAKQIRIDQTHSYRAPVSKGECSPIIN